MFKKFSVTLLVIFALLLAACGTSAPAEDTAAEPTPAPVEPTPEPMDDMGEELPSIAEIAIEDGRFTTLVTALEAAGLAETMAGEGAFTVFAPTDDAFAALPEGALEGLLADTEALTSVLLYHVVDGVVPAADVLGLDGQDVETLSGDSVAITVADGAVMVNEANVVITDIEASNGIIHVIDAVLLPSQPSIAEIAVEDGRFTTLVAALDAAGLVETLSGEGSFTVFAPTDDAFAALPEGTLDSLLADTEALTKVLLYHVLDGEYLAADVLGLDGQMVETLSGDMITITVEDGVVKINDATVIITDIEASNGVIHVIDVVLVP